MGSIVHSAQYTLQIYNIVQIIIGGWVFSQFRSVLLVIHNSQSFAHWHSTLCNDITDHVFLNDKLAKSARYVYHCFES